MKKASSKAISLLILCLGMVLASGCTKDDNSLSLGDFNTQAYSHSTGYEVEIPDSWQPVAQTSSGVYFTDDLNNISLNIVSEIGGMDIYSLEELAQMVKDKFNGHLSNVQELQVMNVKDKQTQYGVVLQGEDEGILVLTKIWIYEPLSSVRYYMIFSCGGDDYANYDAVFTDIIGSFSFAANEDEVFSLLNLSKTEFEDLMKGGLNKI